MDEKTEINSQNKIEPQSPPTVQDSTLSNQYVSNRSVQTGAAATAASAAYETSTSKFIIAAAYGLNVIMILQGLFIIIVSGYGGGITTIFFFALGLVVLGLGAYGIRLSRKKQYTKSLAVGSLGVLSWIFGPYILGAVSILLSNAR